MSSICLRMPWVAIFSAVETVTTKISSTIDAAALCKMAERGQITGGIFDGPLAFDNAIDPGGRRSKVSSLGRGSRANSVVPDLEAGNMLAKNLTFLAKADAAGIVLGARVPIILTSRADSVRSRVASCAVAVLHAHARRGAAALPRRSRRWIRSWSSTPARRASSSRTRLTGRACSRGWIKVQAYSHSYGRLQCVKQGDRPWDSAREGNQRKGDRNHSHDPFHIFVMDLAMTTDTEAPTRSARATDLAAVDASIKLTAKAPW